MIQDNDDKNEDENDRNDRQLMIGKNDRPNRMTGKNLCFLYSIVVAARFEATQISKDFLVRLIFIEFLILSNHRMITFILYAL